MKVTVAEYAGFCFGVERAIKIVTECKNNNVVTYGPIIHNPQVVSELAEKGIEVVEDPAEVSTEQTVVVRTHGIEKNILTELKGRTENIINATCPFVIKVQSSARKLSDKGYPVVVVGEDYHPEVKGIVSYISGECYIVSTVEEALSLPFKEIYGVVAQTTQNEQSFEKILEALATRCNAVEAVNTICSATQNRQVSAVELAGKVDVMIVVGGKNSANTRRLYELCKEVCYRTYYVETESELEKINVAESDLVGITAGASTPNKLVDSVKNCILRKGNMNNEHKNNEEMGMEDFESMLEESLKAPTKGSTVSGVVAQINDNEVIVNIGTKTEGVVDKAELSADVKVGDPVELIVVGFSSGGYVQLSRRMVDERSEWGALKDFANKTVKVKIESHVEKGFRGKIGEIDAFVPEKHIDLKSRMQEPSYYIGKVLPAKVLKVSGGKHKSALVSPKDYILEEANKERKEFFETIVEGSVLKGVVKTLKDYGAFISFGSVDGFLHKSNIAWGRPKNPAKYMQEGQEIEVKILEVNNETGKIEVGLKQLTNDPWDEAVEKYPIGSSLQASVIGRRRNGYISEVEPGVDAFIPLEELSWLRNSRVSVNAKDVVDGRVIDFDSDHKRIIISVKMMHENPWKTIRAETPEGSVIEGTIKNITDFGLFIDFGQFVDGLVRKGDTSWTEEPEDLNTIYKVGDKIEVKVLKIDEERERISLGIKQLSNNPWRDMPKGGSKTTEATIAEVTKSGLNVTLPNGLPGFISIHDLDPARPSLEQYNVGDEVSAVILKADPREKTVQLSIKRLISESERKEAKEYMKKLEKSEEAQSFGNIFKDKFNS